MAAPKITAEYFEEVYEAHAGELEGYILRMTGNRALAADIVQSAFLAAWEKRDTFSGNSSFKTWIFSIGINQAREHFRKKKPIYVSEYTYDPVDEGAHPDSGAEQEEMLVQLREAVAELPEELREVLDLIRFQDMSYSEAAEVLGLTVDTVRMRLHRAMQQLTSRLDPAGDKSAKRGGQA